MLGGWLRENDVQTGRPEDGCKAGDGGLLQMVTEDASLCILLDSTCILLSIVVF